MSGAAGGEVWGEHICEVIDGALELCTERAAGRAIDAAKHAQLGAALKTRPGWDSAVRRAVVAQLTTDGYERDEADAYYIAVVPRFGAAGSRDLVRSLADILADPEALKPPTPVVPRIAWGGRVTLLAGREKSGKSTLIRAGAAAVSAGRPFLGEPCSRAPVLLVALEEHVGDVAASLVKFDANPRALFLLERMTDPLADVVAAVAGLRPALVIIDTLAALVDRLPDPPDPGNSAAWTPIMAKLVAVARDAGAALVLLHHARKSDGAYRDSTAIGANADMLLQLDEGTERGVRNVKVRGRWALEDYAVRLAGDQYELVGGGELSTDMRVYQFVAANPGASKRGARTGVRGKAADIDAALHRLLATGALVDGGDSTRGMSLSVGVSPTVSPSGSPPDGGATLKNPHGHATDTPGTHPGTHPGSAVSHQPLPVGERGGDADEGHTHPIVELET